MLNQFFGSLYFDNILKRAKGKKVVPFIVGDVLGLSFCNKGYSFSFEGLCIAIRKRKVVSPETTFILRNIIAGVGIEVSFSFFYNRVFSLRLNNFKRKKISYVRSKLFYVRHKLSNASRV